MPLPHNKANDPPEGNGRLSALGDKVVSPAHQQLEPKLVGISGRLFFTSALEARAVLPPIRTHTSPTLCYDLATSGDTSTGPG